MEKIDKFASRKNFEKYLWSKFLEGVEKSKSQKSPKDLLEILLTEAEKKKVAKRLAALALLKEGKS